MRIAKALAVMALFPVLLALAGCDDDEWDNPFGEETKLVIANLTATDAEVAIDQHQNGSVRYLGIVPAGARREWEVDTGWAWVYVDGDAVESLLDADYDGWLEIRDE